VVSFSLAPDQGARLTAVAARRKMSRSKLAREAFEKLLRAYEAAPGVDSDEQRAKEAEATT